MDFALPRQKAAIFWPVGTGDATTLVLKPDQMVMQLDLRHLEKADDPAEPEWPVIDHLVRTLPKRNGRPYLALYVLTHADKDHVLGFAELLRRVEIGELWHTPKVFRDEGPEESLCDDAKAFRREAHRRCRAILANPGSIRSGDRLRVIGHDDILNEDKYRGLPDSCKSRPGECVSTVDGQDLSGHFQAFIHAPFKADQEASRNNTSLSLNVVLWEGQQFAQFFFFGDREYPTIKQIFEVTEQGNNQAYLGWHVMLASHHCSKCVMYWRDEGQEDESLRKDIMAYFKKHARDGAYIVSSSHSQFTDAPGDNPPHKRARHRYEEIVQPGRFICTHEYPNKANPQPVTFVLDEQGLKLVDTRDFRREAAALAGAIAQARGGNQPPGVQVGFGAEP
jgi:hypothetical protein